MSNEETPRPSWEEIAASAYRSYAASTGNKNFRGDPMPAFDDLSEPIKIAWQVAVRQVGDIFTCARTAFENEQAWAGWTPPSNPARSE